jgi:dienelactone hydrolase
LNKNGYVLLVLNLILAGFSGILFASTRNTIKTEEVYFNASFPDAWDQIDTSIRLHGRFYYPAGFQKEHQYPTIILFHGLSSNLNSNDHLARQLVQYGILAFAIDFRGHGQSSGNFPFENGLLYNATFGDVMGTYRYLQNQTFFNATKAVVKGTSLGGGAALYMALSGLIPKFVLWYPGTAYIWGSLPLYQYNSSSPDFQGLVFLGTKDECTRCNPENMIQFGSRHPTVELYWLEGATHVDSRFYSETLKVTTDFLLDLWDLPQLSWWKKSIQNGTISLLILVIIASIDLGMIGIHHHRKRTGSRV